MDLIPRFSRLMAEALHCGSTPAGLELPLAEVHERLKLLADEERALPLPEPDVSAAIAGLPLTEETSSPGDAAQRLRLACENARFAVYAWVDEQILQSSRLDATDWLGYSLQYHYFDTTDAGRDFFARLRTLAGSAVPFVDDAAPGLPMAGNPALTGAVGCALFLPPFSLGAFWLTRRFLGHSHPRLLVLTGLLLAWLGQLCALLLLGTLFYGMPLLEPAPLLAQISGGGDPIAPWFTPTYRWLTLAGCGLLSLLAPALFGPQREFFHT